jgi:hypothetical protein
VGPVCEVLIESDDNLHLELIDQILDSVADSINRTRKGRVWDVWVRGRPIYVSVAGSPPVVTLVAGCNDSEDVAILRELSMKIAEATGGVASSPEK